MLVDTHVHFYDCFPAGVFWRSAFAHFEQSQDGVLPGSGLLGCLCLASTGSENGFDRWSRDMRIDGMPELRICGTQEESSLLVEDHAGRNIAVVAGRQVCTTERLEVIVLGCRSRYASDQPAKAVIERALSEGAIPVLPCGFGKFWGHRGSVVKHLIETYASAGLCLGDNGSMPSVLVPRLVQSAACLKAPVLAGTDPLPLVCDGDRAGAFGNRMPGEMDPDAPTASLVRALRDWRPGQFALYGRRLALRAFLRRQCALCGRKLARRESWSATLARSR